MKCQDEMRKLNYADNCLFSENSKDSEPIKPLSEEQIGQREKQVRYGKITDGYQNYKSIIPK